MSGQQGQSFEMGAVNHNHPPASNGAAVNGEGAAVANGSEGAAAAEGTTAASGATQGQHAQPGLNRFRQAAQGNYEVAQQKAMERAAAEKQAALRAQQKASELAHDSYEVAQANKNMANDMRAESDGDGLPPAALDRAAAANLQRVQGQFAANKEMMARNREAMNQAGEEAKARMEEVQGMGRQALETAAAATVDMARGEFEARCAKVAEDEERLKKVQGEIVRREKQLDMLRNRGKPNWPCACCCFSYIVHHDIVGDIPPERQGFMKRAYANWFFTLFLLFANMGTAIAVFVIEPDEKNRGNSDLKAMESVYLQHMIVTIVLCMGMPISFMLWYWPTYKAVGSASSSQYTLAKVGYVIAGFFNLFALVGYPGYGGSGFLYAVSVRNTKHQDVSIAAFCVGALWTIQFIIFIFTYLRIRKFMKEDTKNILKAKTEVLAHQVGI